MYDSTYGFGEITLTVDGDEAGETLPVPDGSYEVEVDDASDMASVRIEITDGSVDTINISSSTGSISIEALYEALGKIIQQEMTGTKKTGIIVRSS